MEDMAAQLSKDQPLLKSLRFFSRQEHANFRIHSLTFQKYYHGHESHEDSLKELQKCVFFASLVQLWAFLSQDVSIESYVKNNFQRHTSWKAGKADFSISILFLSIFFQQTYQKLRSYHLPKRSYLYATYYDTFYLSGGFGNSNPQKICDKLGNLRPNHDQQTAIFTEKMFLGIKAEKVTVEQERVIKWQF